MKHILFFLVLGITVPSAASLTPTEKDKILFMIFENQNKKVITKDAPKCPKGSLEWACVNTTVKSFIMNTFRVNGTQGFSQTTEIHCDLITLELQKNIGTDPATQFWSVDFQREVKQSLKGQWVCKLEVTQADSQQQRLGLAFVMNRDKNRIVSRKFLGWKSI